MEVVARFVLTHEIAARAQQRSWGDAATIKQMLATIRDSKTG
jgi:hypothetical protein